MFFVFYFVLTKVAFSFLFINFNWFMSTFLIISVWLDNLKRDIAILYFKTTAAL